MKIFTKNELDIFLELPIIAGSIIETNKEFRCIHDDNYEGEIDQSIRISLNTDSLGYEVFSVRTPTSPGLRFRNSFGGGSNLEVHNALKVLAYASSNVCPLLPGMERTNLKPKKTLKKLNDMLKGIIVLPPEFFVRNVLGLHHFFEITPNLNVAVSVDGDTHIITEANSEIDDQIRERSTYWNPEPFMFSLNSTCSRAIYNALILLALSVKQSEQQ